MISGDPHTALKAPFSIVLTETMAKKYFGIQDPIGKILRLDNRENYNITGVIKDPPRNSHFHIRMLCSYDSYYVNNPIQKGRWIGDFENYTFLLLQEGADHKEIEKKIPAVVEEKLGVLIKAAGATIEFYIQPLTDIHLHSNLEGELTRQSDIRYIYAYSAIAVFILLIACINFMNLSTARSANRAKEVGMRKVLGADRAKLIRQFLGESLILSIVSFIIAVGLAELALPLINSIAGADLNLVFTKIPLLLLISIGFVLLVGITAGSYPAFYLTAFKPVSVLKDKGKSRSTHLNFRSLMVLVQFTISIALIIGTVVIFRQISYMKDRYLGFNKEQIVFIQITDDSIQSSTETIKAELLKLPGITHASASSHVPSHGSMHNAFVPEGFTFQESQMMGRISADQDFMDTLDIEITKGRYFSSDLQSDKENSILINETAVKKFEWEDPIGKRITELGDMPTAKTVIGVFRDFHTDSLHYTVEPILIEHNPRDFAYISVRLRTGNIPDTMSALEKKWKEFDPTGTFDYAFLDEEVDGQYWSEERLSRIFSYFSMLAVFIACLGLFGLASFTAEQRTKEIGIRKVLGAPIPGILLLLSKEFTKWVVLANIIAWPIVYFVMKSWLQNFAFRIDIGMGIFILSGSLAFLIAACTVCYQALKAALADPIDSLRYE
jgi:putative ABC transport system permease protein